MLLKKPGMVVLAAGAGMVAITPAAFAGEAPTSSEHGHSSSGHHDGDRGHHGHSKDKHGASASNGDCLNGGDQLVGLNCTNVQAPINQLGVLSKYENRDGHGGGASAENGDSANLGDQLVGLNGTNVQAPINQLGVLSSYENG